MKVRYGVAYELIASVIAPERAPRASCRSGVESPLGRGFHALPPDRGGQRLC